MFYTFENLMMILIISLIIIILMSLLRRSFQKYLRFIVIASILISIVFLLKNLNVMNILFDSKMTIEFIAIFMINIFISLIPIVVSLLFYISIKRTINIKMNIVKWKLKIYKSHLFLLFYKKMKQKHIMVYKSV